MEFKTTKKIKELEKGQERHCSRSMTENTLWNLKTTAMSLQAAMGFRSAERTAVSCSRIWDRQQKAKLKKTYQTAEKEAMEADKQLKNIRQYLDTGGMTVYDMTMGTSQMLSRMEERIHDLNSDIEVSCIDKIY